jgi:hypothetical protein
VSTAQPPGAGTDLEPARRAALFTAPPRLGWVFRDRRQLLAPFGEPPPVLQSQSVPPQLEAERAAAEQALRKTQRRITPVSVILLIGFILLAGCDRAMFGGGPALGAVVIGLLAGGPGLVLTGVRYARLQSARQAITQASQQANAWDAQTAAGWQQRKDTHEHAEAARVDRLDEWGPAVVPGHARRIDVFGGSLWGWEALLTVHGASLLAERPLLVADLTGELVCRELAVTARDAGGSSSVHLLPSQLAGTGLLTAFGPAQLADAVCEVMHAGAADTARADKAVDTRILEQVTAALGGQVSFTRLATALRALLGHTAPPGVLDPAEHAQITMLFPADHLQHIQANLIRIESFIAPLAAAGQAAAGGLPAADETARLRCLALEPAARSVRAELLAGLLVQWLTVQVTAAGPASPAVVIAGADEITRPHLERLSDACERRGVPLTLLFRHLRETAADLAGGGAAAFMRLGNHQEATTAADLIGRQHKFVLSQLTATLGGNQTHTRTDTEGWGESATTTRGWHDTTTIGPRQDSPWRLGDVTSRAIGRSESFSSTASRNWSAATSWADGTNWSDAESTQRVYEYTVEPGTLQHLPDHALLLVTARSSGLELTPVECDPAIITLPHVSTTPLPDQAVTPPARTVATPPATAHPAVPGPSDAGWPPWDQRTTGQPPLPPIPPPARQPPGGTPGHNSPGTWPSPGHPQPPADSKQQP